LPGHSKRSPQISVFTSPGAPAQEFSQKVLSFLPPHSLLAAIDIPIHLGSRFSIEAWPDIEKVTFNLVTCQATSAIRSTRLLADFQVTLRILTAFGS